MDDRNFDRKSADDWIAMVEGENADVREQDIYPHIHKWLWDNDIIKVVDLGCGQGVCSSKVPENTIYLGIEPSEHLLERAKENYPNRRFVEGSAYKIPVKSESLDGVFSIAVWHLLSDPEKAAKELSRVLRPGGHFLIVTADPQHEIWKKSSDHLYLRTELQLTSVWERFHLKASRIGAYRHFWFFEGRKD